MFPPPLKLRGTKTHTYSLGCLLPFQPPLERRGTKT